MKESMRNIELAYLATAVAMILIMVQSTEYRRFPTFSHISMGTKTARLTFSWGLCIAGLLFALLMFAWLIPHFLLGDGFRILTIGLVGSQILTGLFPVNGNRLGVMHTLFGSILALSMVILLLSFTFKVTVPLSVRVVCGMAVVSMAAAFVSIPWMLKDKKQLLFHETVFFGIWHAPILITAYIA